MNVVKLISRSKFNSETIDLPTTLTDERLHTFIIEAQEAYLAPLVGEALYYDLQKNVSEARNVELMGGVEYEDAAGNLVAFPGLSMALVYWTAVRLYKRQNANIASNSIVKKDSSHSTHLTPEELAQVCSDFHAMAATYATKAKKFLNDKGPTVYPLYFKSEKTCSTAPLKISAIGGESSNNYFNNGKRCNDYNY